MVNWVYKIEHNTVESQTKTWLPIANIKTKVIIYL